MGKKWYVIGRGFSGWHATGVNVRSSGGYLERMPWMKDDESSYAESAVEGALVYDARHLESDTDACNTFIDHVVKGPMCDPSLSLDGANRFVAHEDKPYGALDHVGMGIFETLLRNVRGIKIGHVRNGRVVWENV